jgi:glyoxylase-like metal-dependent hydrolase (beta-lactamase superfamily II)
MRLHTVLLTGIAAVSLAACSNEPPRTGLAAVSDAMGATNLNSIQYSASGSNFGFGQAYMPGEKWPRFEQRSYDVSINYGTAGMKIDAVRSQGEHPPHGGAAQPVAGDQRTVLVVGGKFAWNEAGNQANPAPDAAADRAVALWATPHGVIKAAIANNGTLQGNNITFNVDGREVKATLNAANQVEKVTYLRSNDVVGDLPVEITYSDYADYGGVKFPRHIVQSEDGFPTLDVMVESVRPNAEVAIAAPANVQQAPPPPELPAVTSDRLAPGVWYMHADGVHSWAVEFNNFIVVVEGIGRDARSLAVNEEIRKLIPNKPIRSVVNTHAHYDHAGGLRTYPAQGITVITDERNKAFYEETWKRPHTLSPDTLAKNPKEPVFDTINADKKVITDGRQTLEIYRKKNAGHNGADLLVFLPREGIVFWGDGYNPPNGDVIMDPQRTPEYGIDLVRNIQELKLNVRTIAPAHGAGARPYANLLKAVGMMSP